jgi:hypothetical protein
MGVSSLYYSTWKRNLLLYGLLRRSSILQETRPLKLFNNTEKSELYILQYFRPINMTTNMLFDNILNIKLPVYKFIFIKLKFLKTCQSSCHIQLLCGEIYHCLANDTCVTMKVYHWLANDTCVTVKVYHWLANDTCVTMEMTVHLQCCTLYIQLYPLCIQCSFEQCQ